MKILSTLGVMAIPYFLLIVAGLLVGGFTRTEALIKLDPTIRFWVVALLLGGPSLWRNFNIFQACLDRFAVAPHGWWKALLRYWVNALVILGVLNLLVAFTASTDTWVYFKVLGLVLLFWIFAAVLALLHHSRTSAPAKT